MNERTNPNNKKSLGSKIDWIKMWNITKLWWKDLLRKTESTFWVSIPHLKWGFIDKTKERREEASSSILVHGFSWLYSSSGEEKKNKQSFLIWNALFRLARWSLLIHTGFHDWLRCNRCFLLGCTHCLREEYHTEAVFFCWNITA